MNGVNSIIPCQNFASDYRRTMREKYEHYTYLCKGIKSNTTSSDLTNLCLKHPTLEIFNPEHTDSLDAVTQAALHGNESLIKYLITNLKDVINKGNSFGYTSLFTCCLNTSSLLISSLIPLGQTYRGVKKLLELGANPNIATLDGETCIEKTATHRVHIILTSLLLRHGAETPSDERKRELPLKYKTRIPVWEQNISAAAKFNKFPEKLLLLMPFLRK